MKALMIIDIQNWVTNRNLYNKELFFETVNHCIEKAKKNADLIIAVQHVNKQMPVDSDEWTIDSRINADEVDAYFTKTEGNAFSNKDLVAFLKEKCIEEIEVCGLVTHGCIRYSCIGGLKEGFAISLIKNGHTSWNKDAEKKTIETEAELETLGVKII